MKDKWIKVTAYELGYLFGSIPTEKLERMKTDAPKLWLQIMIGITEAYAYSKGHPAQKQSWKELRNLKARLGRILRKEAAYNNGLIANK